MSKVLVSAALNAFVKKKGVGFTFESIFSKNMRGFDPQGMSRRVRRTQNTRGSDQADPKHKRMGKSAGEADPP